MQLPTVAEKAHIEDLRLGDVPMQQEVELVSIDLPMELAEPLLERGVLPGCRICPVQSSPGGDPGRLGRWLFACTAPGDC